MNPAYNLGIKAYQLAVRLAALRGKKARTMLEGQKRTFDLLREKLNPAHRYIWIHAHLRALWEVDDDRTGTTGACNVECTAYCPCYVLGTTYLIAPLADRLSQTYEVDFLKSVSAKCAHAHLSGNDDNRRRVNHGIGNTCQSVGNARTARNQAHSYLTTNARETPQSARENSQR